MNDHPFHLAVMYPHGHDAQWSASSPGSQTDPAALRHMAGTAERGLFDFFLLAESLRLPEHHGLLEEYGQVGRPEPITALSALAATTRRIGLAATLSTTYNEPGDVAHRLASLHRLSEGRCAWNIVTDPSPAIGANFRCGPYLPPEQRYLRATHFTRATRRRWAAGDLAAGAPPADPSATALRPPRQPRHPVGDDGPGDPVLIQAGNSGEGRDFGASTADVVFGLPGPLSYAAEFADDIKRRARAHRRDPGHVKVMHGAGWALGATREQAWEKARETRRAQTSPTAAVAFLERIWQRDLSGLDPDGPLPSQEPADPADGELVQRWRSLAEARRLSVRDLVIHLKGPLTFVGTPSGVADEIARHARNTAVDGLVLLPSTAPEGLDDFVDDVLPLLQERGICRSEYTATTLRGHLRLPQSLRHRTLDQEGNRS
ncbi:LLM class flavin-dependent oxidoreductase [Streptomyces sp. NPDC048514]|uniref:LLM class flavin-dependent oxidoreductase n=1 Tax=Streptomyces sp. NPDC048514 TaxID=3365564 RepID=UPI0037107474